MDSTNQIVSEREKTHGNFTKTARVIQALKRVIHEEFDRPVVSDFQLESLDMIVHKIGRIVSGDPNCKDHWDDIAGYARLVSDRLSSAKPVPKVRNVGIADITDVD